MRISLCVSALDKYTEQDWRTIRKSGRWRFVLIRAICDSAFFIAMAMLADSFQYGHPALFSLFVCPVIFFGACLWEMDKWDRLQGRFSKIGEM